MENTKTTEDIIALAERALSEGLLDKAEQYCQVAEMMNKNHAAEDNQTPNERLEKLSKEIKEKRKKKERIHIHIAGDSLSLPRPWYLKHYDPLYNPFLATGYFETYPILLEKELEKITKLDARVSNISDRAYKITNISARLPDVFGYYNPDVVIIQVGVSDCWLRGENLDEQNVPIDKFEKEYRKILDYKKRAGPNKLMLTVGICPTIPALFERNKKMPEVIKEYNSMLSSIKDENLVFFDPIELFDPKNPNELMHLDGIHLSTSGHKIFAKKLAEIIADNYSR